MSDSDVISTNAAPRAIGPYSQARRAGGFVFVSGQIGLTPDGVLVEGGVAAETRQALQNVGAILAAAGRAFTHVVKTTVFLADMADFSAMNAAYENAFGVPAPARSTVAVAALPRNARVEIEVIAMV